jgi:zinc transport system permease protein
MSAFFRDFAGSPILQQAMLAGLLASVACGIIGSYVVVRRITYIAGGIAHCVLGGIGAALYFAQVLGWHWLHPIHGALIAGLGAAFIIGWVSLRAKEREDTIISALWAIGMAVGIVFIAKTPGPGQDAMSYLFGDIVLVTKGGVIQLLILDAVIVAIGLLFYNQFLATCFDEEFSRLRGLNVEAYYLLLLALTALTVVVLATIVGVVMVIALLTLPAAIAGQFCKRLWAMMLLAIGLTAVFTTGGIIVSYGPELSPGAAIILLAGAAYLVTTIGGAVVRKLRK